MEPAQKRQRVAATTMQLVSLLPKEVQAGVLMWAMEPTPTAALVKAAVGDMYGEQRWWTTAVAKDAGYQKYLKCHTPCIRLWARVADMLPDGSLAWKWSETNVFLNKSGRLHVRGDWEDLQLEMAARMTLGKKSPKIDKYLADGVREVRRNPRFRELYVNVTPPGYLTQCFDSVRCSVVLANVESCHFRLEWSPMAANHSMWLYGHCKGDREVCIEACKQRLVLLGVH